MEDLTVISTGLAGAAGEGRFVHTQWRGDGLLPPGACEIRPPRRCQRGSEVEQIQRERGVRVVLALS